MKNVNVHSGLLIFSWAIILSSCNHGNNSTSLEKNRIIQQKDGSLSLRIDNAECYYDVTNPKSNTAEWEVLVSISGQYNIWLSSATKDTANFKYENPVAFIFLDDRIEGKPGCDKIIQNSGDVQLPWFRADSFIGSLYIPDTGMYYIQMISDKIIPANIKNEDNDTKLLSVYLTQLTR